MSPYQYLIIREVSENGYTKPWEVIGLFSSKDAAKYYIERTKISDAHILKVEVVND